MEPRFENCCTLTKEALRSMMKRNRNPVFTAAVIALSAAYLYRGLRAALAGSPSALIVPLITSAALCAFAWLLPEAQAWLEHRKNLMAYGRDAKCITKFYEDRFVVDNLTADESIPIPYTRIRKVAEDERYLFLLLDTRVISPVDKSDFLRGTAEEFSGFIRAKAVNTSRRRSDKPDWAL